MSRCCRLLPVVFLALFITSVHAAPPAPNSDGQWLMPAKNHAGTRFSELNQITADNVKQLQVAWTFSTGLTAGHEAAPLVVNNTMYLVTPYPNLKH